MITVSNVSINFSGTDLFKEVDLKFTPGNCYGVIGANGAGKSTFLKVLTGELEPTTGDVIIPDTLGGFPVTAISLYAFAECESITGVSIPDSVKKIGHYAFSDCTALKVVLIGKNVTEMGNNVFSNCTGLEKFSVSADNAVYSSDENGVLYNKNKVGVSYG